jgi:hypothetical protein
MLKLIYQLTSNDLQLRRKLPSTHLHLKNNVKNKHNTQTLAQAQDCTSTNKHWHKHCTRSSTIFTYRTGYSGNSAR